jgi:hypothetical protein
MQKDKSRHRTSVTAHVQGYSSKQHGCCNGGRKIAAFEWRLSIRFSGLRGNSTRLLR